MKTIIVALNSKYIHSSLAPWYLKSSCGNECGEIKILEYTINDEIDKVLSSIYLEKADIAAFSCYIWNISIILKLIENLKKVSPLTKIILGGPEVAFDPHELMISNTAIDYIISGEGEVVFKLLLENLCDENKDFKGIQGITYRDEGAAVSNEPSNLIEELDSLPTPYTKEMLNAIGNKIVYYEASRGCPFSCSYCISSTFDGVRYFTLKRIKNDLMQLITSDVRQVKFVDRTFNCNRERAKEIFKFIIDYYNDNYKENIFSERREAFNKDMNFHFEAAADLFDDEMIDILSLAPSGLIQFEVGVQTTNLNTLELVNRKTSLEKVFHYIKRIKRLGTISLHLDLIAGLPGEDFNSFKKSFEEVYNLRPNQLQLGFLKLLKGSRIRKEADIHNYLYRGYPPYEILNNKYISFDEILVLKGIEALLERYFNSGRFMNLLEYVISKFFTSAFNFFSEFLLFFSSKGYIECSLSSRKLYDIVYEFIRITVPNVKHTIINGLLKLDYLSSDNSNNLPSILERIFEKSFSEHCFAFLKDEKNVIKYLSDFDKVPSKQIYKKVHFEIFEFDIIQFIDNGSYKEDKTVILFNYDKRNKVTGLYEYHKVNIY